MQVIPVIDLLDSQAVRAVRGERESYRPIVSQLCAGSAPLDVACALLEAMAVMTAGAPVAPVVPNRPVAPITSSEAGCDARSAHSHLSFPEAGRIPTEQAGARGGILYVADLGAILGRGAHIAALAQLCDRAPCREIWVDGGFAGFGDMQILLEQVAAQRRHASGATLVPVFGTESLRTPEALPQAEAAGLDPVLSLDFRAGAPMGMEHAHAVEDSRGAEHLGAVRLPRETPPHPAGAPRDWWPARIIVMTLDRVGAYGGPDLEAYARWRELANRTRPRACYGAGGIRAGTDLDAAAAAHADGWLVASALHDRKFTAPQVA